MISANGAASLSAVMPAEDHDRGRVTMWAADNAYAFTDPVGVAEIEFGEVAVQMGFADVLVNAVDAALQDREITFGGVGVDVLPDILLCGSRCDGSRKCDRSPCR